MSIRSIILIALLVCPLITTAQNSLVEEAKTKLQSGDFSEAQIAIDKAVENSTSSQTAETWYQYGRVYKALFEQSNTSQYLTLAVKGYQTAQEKSNSESYLYSLSQSDLEMLWSSVINEGSQAYGNGDPYEAVKYFDYSKLIKPHDTLGYLYSGISRQQSGDYSGMLEDYKKLIELGYSNKREIYNSIIFYTGQQSSNSNDTHQWINRALEDYPNDSEFLKRKINLYINDKQEIEARTLLKELIQAEPDNANLYFNLAYLYENTNQEKLAVETYEESLKVDPNYFNSLYNLGVYYFNQAADKNKEIANLPIHEFEEKAPPLEIEFKSFLRKSLPYMEKASEVKADEPILWHSLYQIYSGLKFEDKANAAYLKYKQLNDN